MLRLITALSAVAVALATIGFATRADGQTPTAGSPFQAAYSDFTPNSVRDFAPFALYSLGSQFRNLPLTRITRTFEKPNLSAVGGAAFNLPDNRTNYVNFIYGTCNPLGEYTCAPPLTVQIWPACDATLADFYYNTPPGVPSRPYELINVRGVPAAKFDDMLQIYAGRVTIVVFGDTEVLRLDAAANLAAANAHAGGISRTDPLPAPAAGAMEGKLVC
jgi:hypothetical protein